MDSDRTVDSDELEEFINSQRKKETSILKVTKSKAIKSSKSHDISDSDSSDSVVKKKQKKYSKDSDSDRTVDSDELEEFIARSQTEEKSSTDKTVFKKAHQTVYKEISDSDKVITKKNFLEKVSNKKPLSRYKDSDEKGEKKKDSVNTLSKRKQSRYKEMSDSDSENEVVKKKTVSEKISNKKPLSRHKEISDSDSDEVANKKKGNEKTLNKRPQSNFKEISDSDEVDSNKKKGNEKILNKRPLSNYKEISDSDSDEVYSNEKKGNEKILNKKPQSNYKEISDSDSDEVDSNKKKGNEKTLSKRPQSNFKEISDSDSENKVVKKQKVLEKTTNKKPQSRYKEMSDSDSDEIVKKKKVNENISNKKPASNYKKISDPSDEIEKKRKIAKSTSSKKREKCMYGKKCYRKNPDHIKNFDHGDSDDLEDQGMARSSEIINPAVISKQAMNKNGKEFSQKKESPRKERGDDSKGTNKEKSSPSKEKSIPSRNLGSTSSDCKNYHFYLTKVNGIPPKYNCLAYDIKDLLSFKDGTLVSSVQFNYLFDIPWLVCQYPENYRKCPITIVHGEQRQSKKALEKECAPFPNIKLCQAKLDIPFGTHHTKMMFLLYKEGFKIIIHTSNIVDSDWDQRTQGMWVSPMLPELKNASTTEGESPTNFKADLLEYVTAYSAPGLEEWLQVIKKHDFSSIRVVLIASVPGRFVGSKKTSFGHLKLRKVLNLHGSSKDTVSTAWPIICQFSSIGSLGSSPCQWMTGEFGTSLSTIKDVTLSCQSSNMKLVFPTVENVRKSLQGYPAGTSLPYSIKVAEKQTYLKNFMHQWKSEKLGRSEASPHIKTYLRVSPDNSNIAWFLLTSANLSKAAWGALEKKDTQLMIRSYELGVLYLPKFFGLDTFSTPFSTKTDFKKMFPVPYDIPIEPYSANDEPWIWDIPHVHAPDRYGMKWCPPLK